MIPKERLFDQNIFLQQPRCVPPNEFKDLGRFISFAPSKVSRSSFTMHAECRGRRDSIKGEGRESLGSYERTKRVNRGSTDEWWGFSDQWEGEPL